MKRKNRNGKEPQAQPQNPAGEKRTRTWFDLTLSTDEMLRTQFKVSANPNGGAPSIELTKRQKTIGRPRKVAIAREADKLRNAGMNYPQIAAELNKRHGTEDPNHSDHSTADAVRKLLKRHYPDKT